MRSALKAVGWILAGIVALVLWAQADKITQWGVAIFVVGGWLLHNYDKDAERRHQLVLYQLQQLSQKVDSIIGHPLNTRYIADGIEGLVDEYKARERGRRDAGM